MARGFSHSGHSSGGHSGGGHSGGHSGGGYGGPHGGYGGGGPRGPRPPMRMHFFGRTVVLAGPAQWFMSILLGVLALGIVFSVGMFGNYSQIKTAVTESKEMIEKYESYSEIYSNIITKAKAGTDGYYVVNATFAMKKFEDYSNDPTETGYYATDHYEKGQYYYFVVYNFNYHASDTVGATKTNPYNDSTFLQFTYDDIRDMNGTIEVAYTYIDGKVWAINTDYTLAKNKDYDDEKIYYESVLDGKKTCKKMIVVDIIVIAIVVAVLAVFISKKYKQAQKDQDIKNAKSEAELAEAQAKADIAEKKAQQVGRVCKYCGASVPDGAEDCPACGSRQFKK